MKTCESPKGSGKLKQKGLICCYYVENQQAWNNAFICLQQFAYGKTNYAQRG